jgi:hypothetical protein
MKPRQLSDQMRWGTVHTVVSVWLVRLHDCFLKQPRCYLCSGALDLSWVIFAGTNAFPQGGNFKAAAAAALSGAPTISGTATQVCRVQGLLTADAPLLKNVPGHTATSSTIGPIKRAPACMPTPVLPAC